MTTNIKKCVFSALIGMAIGPALALYAQTPPSDQYGGLEQLFPGEQAVFLQKNELVNVTHSGDSLLVKVKVHEEMLLLGENFPSFASDRVYYSASRKISNLKAYTLIPGKRKAARMDVTEFKDSQSPGSNIFYDDQRTISFTYPGVQKGATTVLDYEITIADPRLIGDFMFNSYIPVHSTTYRLTFDNDIGIQPHLYNADSVKIHLQKTVQDQTTTLEYTANDLKAIPYDDNAPAYTYTAATVYCMITGYRDAGGKHITLLDSIKDLHRWYRTFVDKLDNSSNDVRQLVDSIVQQTSDTLTRVKEIFGWVQNNIKYIAFEDGMRAFVPHNPGYVISKRYGDCKDMACTLVDMLRISGIPAYYTWVGTRDFPYRYTDIASPLVDNHMIATVMFRGKTYFLDATGAYMPFDLPSSMIQGKECLISEGDDNFKVMEVPVIPKERNVMMDSVYTTLQDGAIAGKGQVTLTGYAKIFNTYRLTEANKQNVDDYVKRLLTKGNNKFNLEKYSIDNLHDSYRPLLLSYDFIIPDYYHQVGSDIYINLVLDKTMTDALLDKRKAPLENEYNYINRSVVILSLPKGYVVNDIPSDREKDGGNFGYSIKYKVTGDSLVTVTREFYVNYLIMQPNSFQDWDQRINEYASACRDAIVLKRKME